MNHADLAKAGFLYLVEVLRNGIVVDRELVHNIMPTEGLNHVLNVVLKGSTQIGTWYLAPFEGNYTPIAGDTAAAFPAAATECTAYSESTRQQFVPGTVSAGALDNAASRAEFTFNATKTVYGGFMTGASAKGATTSVLLSAVKFSSPKSLDSGSVLRVTAGITLTS